jgi:hypothetical protein
VWLVATLVTGDLTGGDRIGWRGEVTEIGSKFWFSLCLIRLLPDRSASSPLWHSPTSPHCRPSCPLCPVSTGHENSHEEGGHGGISTVQNPGLAENPPERVRATHVPVPDKTHGNPQKADPPYFKIDPLAFFLRIISALCCESGRFENMADHPGPLVLLAETSTVSNAK